MVEGKKISLMAEERAREGKPFVSLEFFPPKTAKGVENLVERIQRMKSIDPLFVDFTWGAGGSTSELTLDLSLKAQQEIGVQANMHLTCTNMEAAKVDAALEGCKRGGIRNILALRGDPPEGQEAWEATEGGFACALDLVKHIRKEHGDYFDIAVAGYPEGHPTKITLAKGGYYALSEAERGRCRIDEKGDVWVCTDADFEGELAYLQAKVDAGASAVVTQMFFDAQVFLDFVAACRARGITVPILPGVICIEKYAGFVKMAEFCRSRVPEALRMSLYRVKDDERAVRRVGVRWGADLCRRLLAAGAPGLHFYTLNLERVCAGILEELGLAGEFCRKPAAKIASLLARSRDWLSFEYFPPRTAEGLANLEKRFQKMKAYRPLFADITWGAGGSSADVTLGLAKKMQVDHGLVTNMHLTCTNMPEALVHDALRACRRMGVRNIVALRGDPPEGQEAWEATEGGFSCALDLVRYIRATYGDFFGISVAGYPEGHPSKIKEVPGGLAALSPSERRRCRVARGGDGEETVLVCSDEDFRGEMAYLKAKVDAGADFIITQMFFDPEVYIDFVAECRKYGINCPVVPGIMCVNNYGGTRKMTDMCKTRVPQQVWDALEPIKNDVAALKAWGVDFGERMSRRLMEGGAPGLHYYTLNLDKVTLGIVDALGKGPSALAEGPSKQAAVPPPAPAAVLA